MAESIASDLVARLLEYLGKSVYAEIASYFGGDHELKKLKETMEMIQARVFDAERHQEGERSALVKLWLKRLKSVLYHLEDLFDDGSMAQKDQEQQEEERRGQRLKSAHAVVSLGGSFMQNKKVSQVVEDIMKELESIESDMAKFNFRRECTIDLQGATVLTKPNSRDTHSFIMEEEVIGREADKEAIVEMLLNTNLGGEGSVCVIPIVGIGGMGKTTLAQFCYNDNKVQQHFEVKAWTCISKTSNLQGTAGKILSSMTGQDCGGMSMEVIQSRLREAVNDRRYVLVLDDVWDEDRERWLKLRSLLSCGKLGSKILVTTRSHIVADNMGTVVAHELGGLSEDKSWELFRSLAFKEGQEERNPNLTSIGKEIVEKCARVPLAIRTIAALLYSKDTEQQWASIKDNELSMIKQGANEQNDIMATLKISYDHLPSSLKQCFAYCSLFPKDYEFDKEELVWLWMAQGFVPPKDSGHECFMELQRRCFFQDLRKDWFGNIKGCKMHDLLHDLACMVGDECWLIGEGSVKPRNDTIRHLRFRWVHPSWKAPSQTAYGKQIRSFLIDRYYCGWNKREALNNVWPNLTSLRALDIAELSDETRNFANSIEKLVHLRYLKIKNCKTPIPSSITKLQNLQTLVLYSDAMYPKLPEEFCKLSSLKHLKMNGSSNPNPMPRLFGTLNSLERLNVFVAEDNNGIDALASMNLYGELKIFFRRCRENAIPEAEAANLKDKKLTSLEFDWSLLADDESVGKADKELKWLQPPPTLQELRVEKWKGVRFPSWGMGDSLRNLVSVWIRGCKRCEYLPPLSRLPCLRSLNLADLVSLEYIDQDWVGEVGSSSRHHQQSTSHAWRN